MRTTNLIRGCNRRRMSVEMRDRKFAITSVGLNLTSFIVRLPFAIALLTCVYSGLWIPPEQLQMIFTIVVAFSILENADVFFVNLSFNSIFYAEFLDMFGFKKKNQNIISSETNKRRSLSRDTDSKIVKIDSV